MNHDCYVSTNELVYTRKAFAFKVLQGIQLEFLKSSGDSQRRKKISLFSYIAVKRLANASNCLLNE
ncbi:CLUMA_CG008577, isoform A [Clunio marinus]|uniref:CLUMA_CG008577, isoform A n=1 Tax=Clunio marinus TaxID=568069 RepID=A0A1J1I4I0_9DIPT|nr:CLUMA_CG008577, isoform A [Clunio marinus]